ncbi:Eukaryotic initiation factor 4A [Echinococcus granulosus]|uniref:RNA helicase n=1 Tax=Echinococcus granulosus TaxID=6210 RepID=A0A068X0W4_ECHGR|nr:Eukaryotic initiation factor 4A [Echinococcus granulosus]CDS24381.1 eukaryotic initiation factor 4A [Echinococcus granulosus]
MQYGVGFDGEIETNYHETVESFDQLGLRDEVLRGIYQYGFERPSAIQQRAILPCLQGRDVIAQAQSGTGKTATFTISILQKLDTNLTKCQALVLAPTRELAKQIQSVIQKIGHLLNVKCYACIGGTRLQQDLQVLPEGQHVVVGTPGRVFDMMERQVLSTDYIKIFVLDEADEMLSRGFETQIQNIFSCLPDTAQVILLSATMPPEIFEITKKMIKDPVKILVKKEELTLDGIRQFYIQVKLEDYKLPTLLDLYTVLDLGQVVIFVNTVKKAINLKEELVRRKFKVSCIHSDLTQEQRDAIMSDFRSGSSKVLLSTDILARGIDVQQVSLVLNYDLPNRREVYIHRIGRSGRFGRKGVAINFVTEADVPLLDQLMNYYHTQILEMPDNIMDLL